jgi:CubicO group peptidase (beta-lactamase class C family)
MHRTEYERVTPESVGIPSGAILRMIEAFESFTEMHGLMIMRHGKVCFECWWAPYAPGIRHGLQSLTKTYAATAIGIACTEGILSLEEKITNVFPRALPEKPSEKLKKMRIRDVLCMGCGMETMPPYDKEWIRGFLATPVVHEPGTAFMYNTTGSTILGAIIREKTGLGLQAYLKPRLFDKIGINADNLRWLYTPDGLEMGGGGLFATTEDNLRLMHLYLNKGVWDRQRILSEEFVNQAITKRIDTSGYPLNGPDAFDHFMGYGFQIWMCQPEGVYRADGAFGQYAIVFPDLDMVVSFNETYCEPDDSGSQKPLDVVWKYLLPYIQPVALPKSPEYHDQLAKKISGLAIKNPLYMPYSDKIAEIQRKKFLVTQGNLTLFTDIIAEITAGKRSASCIKTFSFNFQGNVCIFSYEDEEKAKSVEIATDGSRKLNLLNLDISPVTELYLNGAWISNDTFEVAARWIESCQEKTLRFSFIEDRVDITSEISAAFEDKRLPPSTAILIKGQ